MEEEKDVDAARAMRDASSSSTAKAPAGDLSPAGAQSATTQDDTNPLFPLPHTSKGGAGVGLFPTQYYGPIYGEPATDTGPPKANGAWFAPSIQNLLAPESPPNMPEGIRTSLAAASPPQRRVRWDSEPAQYCMSPNNFLRS